MSRGHGDKRDRKQETAIMALLTESTLKQAADKVGIGESTLWRWMQDPDFKDRFREAKKQVVSQAVSRLQQSCGEAVDTLRIIMNDTLAPAHSRVAAAKTIIEMTIKAVENEELEARLEQLEQMMQEDNRTRGIR